jgi:hypothetical protein
MLDWRCLPRTISQTLAACVAIDGCLPGGISGADEGDLLARNEFPFERRGPVVHARGLELFEVWHVEPPVAGAAGNNDVSEHVSAPR